MTTQERAQHGLPYAEQRGSVTTQDWLLTNVIWHRCYGEESGSYETGIRRVRLGKAVDGSFDLIQHGWVNFDAANRVILSRLNRGWSAYRIATFMDFLSGRKRWLRSLSIRGDQ